jgi:hypothetical protein
MKTLLLNLSSLFLWTNSSAVNAAAAAASTLSQHASQLKPSQYYGVRSLQDASHPSNNNVQDNVQEQADVERRNFAITFSADGIPIILPFMKLQLFPTSGQLSNNARVILGSAFSDYLRDQLTKEWDKDDTIADISSVTVEIMGVRAIGDVSRRLVVTTGSEATIQTTLTFDALDSPPSDAIITQAVDKATKNLDKFVKDYLITSGLDELLNVESADAIEDSGTQGFSVPSAAPVPDDVGNNNNNNNPTGGGPGPKGGGLSQANEQLNNNPEPAGNLRILIPASVAGLAVFMLTAFFIAQRRRNVTDLDDSYNDNDRFNDEIDVRSGSRFGKDDIEVRPIRLGMDTHNRDMNMMDGGRTTMHIPARDYAPSPIRITASSASSSSAAFSDVHHPTNPNFPPTGEGQYVRRMLDSNSYNQGGEDGPEYSSDYSEGSF